MLGTKHQLIMMKMKQKNVELKSQRASEQATNVVRVWKRAKNGRRKRCEEEKKRRVEKCVRNERREEEKLE